MEERIKQLEQAIRDAHEWLKTGEGVGLLYYYADYCSPTSKQSYSILSDVLGDA